MGRFLYCLKQKSCDGEDAGLCSKQNDKCALARRTKKKASLSHKSALEWLRNCAHFGEVCGHLETPVSPLTQTLASFLVLCFANPTFVLWEYSYHPTRHRCQFNIYSTSIQPVCAQWDVTECIQSIFRCRCQQMRRKVPSVQNIRNTCSLHDID
jgi:hypothetical protein